MPNKERHPVSTETNIEKEIKALNIAGLKTIFDVTAESPAQFIEQVVNAKGSVENAEILYQRAKDKVEEKNAEKRAQQLRNDPVLQGITKLSTLDEATPLRASAKSLADNNIPERAKQYVSPSSIQSMFSPGRYLCELYNVAQELHDGGNSLHIDNRRPDLQKLVLSNEQMEHEVSTLDILLSTLQGKINLSDLLTADTAKSGDDTFTLPYDDNLAIINAVLESKSISLRDIVTQLADNSTLQAVALTPALVQEQLGLNPASYDLLVNSDLSTSERLAHAAKLTIYQLNDLLSHIKVTDESQVLAVVSEYVRLQRQYSLSVDQFTAMIDTAHSSERLARLSGLFNLSQPQLEMLFSLSGKSEDWQKVTEADPLKVLAIFNELETTVQWMNEQKLDLPTLNAMLTTQYSATATPELFNFLSNIYHSIDVKQTDVEISKQNLCRALAAGFHLKTEVVAGLATWLESHDKDFTLEKFNQTVIKLFSNEPTLEKLELHSSFVIECQKLSQYVLIAQWAKLTAQDIAFLLQPKLFNGSEEPLQLELSSLRLLAEFKTWQQQVKVPISEALRYFSLFSDHTDVDKLSSEINELEKKLEEENKNSEFIDTQYKELSNKIKPLEILVKKLDREAAIIESNIKIKLSDIRLLMVSKDAGITIDEEKLKKLTNERVKLIDDLQSKTKDKQIKVQEIKELSLSLNLVNTQRIPFNKKREELQITIKNKKNTVDELTHSEESTLVKIHGWNHQQTNEFIYDVFTNKYPTKFIDISKLCKHINMCHQVKITSKYLLNLTSLASEMDNSKLKLVINLTAEGFIASL
ncbi:Tc toxin subunit A [Yersinia enterocolitica]|uniref:Tc toxin subunit A n=1 Tax=Yersinia enterocolitica TaxID=630 RepID=UPI000327EB44|nr:Tc toxin subunit A [Yersinia enterocolitica]CCV60000.1 putative insecticidal toxin complex protein [Yersinia enterocolitica (type O:2) str. YE3094/96]CNE60525.1 putative insecticidal toxin complex protein [Yersinia enterocolitica]